MCEKHLINLYRMILWVISLCVARQYCIRNGDNLRCHHWLWWCVAPIPIETPSVRWRVKSPLNSPLPLPPPDISPQENVDVHAHVGCSIVQLWLVSQRRALSRQRVMGFILICSLPERHIHMLSAIPSPSVFIHHHEVLLMQASSVAPPISRANERNFSQHNISCN